MPRTLSAKLALLSILLSLLLLASWIFWCFHDTKQALLTQKKQDLSILLDRTADYVRLYSEGLNANLLALSSSLEVMEPSATRIQKALSGFQSSNPGKVLSVACITEGGDVYCNRTAAYEIFGRDYFQPFYDEVAASTYQGLRWSEPYISPLTLDRTVALYKPVRLGDESAAVVMEINLRTMLSSILRATNDASLTWCVLSGEGRLIATSDDYTTVFSSYKQIPRELLEDELIPLAELPMGAESCRIGGSDYLFFRRTHLCMDWTLMALAQQHALQKAVSPLLTRTLLMGTLHLLLLTALLALLAHRYTRPIVRMAAQIQSSDNPLDLSLADSMRRSDETGILARSIDDMIGRVKRLNAEQQVILKQQRLLEIDVLQGQIHPHFLGNTLACIQSLVKDGRSDDALKALTALCRLLNYSIARTDETAVLKDELACAQAYVALRRMRASYPFEYSVYVPAAHMEHPVPRLILQPIIENSIVHGFAALGRPGTIVVTSYEQEGKLFLCIDDDGIGAPERRLASVAAGSVVPSAHAHGIGVNNVFKRLRLNDPGANACRILSKREGGVRVILDLGPYSPERRP